MNTTGRKKTVPKRIIRPYEKDAREYEELMDQLDLKQSELLDLFGYAGRTSRRYKKGDGKLPLSTLKLMRLMAKGVLTKRQVMRA